MKNTTITISGESLKELLNEAYEAGWFGSLELKESAIDELLEKAKKCASSIHDSSTFTYNAYNNAFFVGEWKPQTITVDLNNVSDQAWQNAGDG
jgi:hypothetical protein